MVEIRPLLPSEPFRRCLWVKPDARTDAERGDASRLGLLEYRDRRDGEEPRELPGRHRTVELFDFICN